ncbi:CNP1-like family protein [Chitinilyticum aquatile]|uniref:CNP1-like family protein n=1 Tax=Chitinilyticum aquatile TaxID=362520 RepID=UPI0004241D15|nr:CNP1-like family protein [Chitinilyticum aquatile]
MRASLLIGLLLAGVTTSALADEFGNHAPDGTMPGEDGLIRGWINSKKAPPKEGEFTLPELAKLQDWATVTVLQPVKNNNFGIALDSVSIGPDDEIVRYVFVVESKRSKVRNYIYEGIDCFSSQYRTYGWGKADGSWLKNENTEWKDIVRNTHNAWQADLMDEMCRAAGPYKLPDIVSNLRTKRMPGECTGCSLSQ